MLLHAANARAQTTGKVAIGASFTNRTALGNGAGDSKGPGFAWRIGHDKTGWGWHYGLNWFSTSVDRSIGGSDVDLGELRVRPLMGGYGYTFVTRRTSFALDMLAGYSFNKMTLSARAADAYRSLGALDVNTAVRNSIVARPELNIWQDVNRKMGINVNIGYTFARPRVLVRTPLGVDDHRVRADMLAVTVGAVYRIF